MLKSTNRKDIVNIMTEKLVLSVLVANQSGVLQRVAALFSRRGFNIESLTVSETEDPAFSRMTIVTTTQKELARQIKMQLMKLEIVKKVTVFDDKNSVSSELLLIKVRAKGIEKKNELLEINRRFGARVMDVTLESLTLELTGRPATVDSFIDEISAFGIIELARTGMTSLARGSDSFNEDV
ncbi:MAG: acetolactate synthase small subunit [Clostridiales bacterium]|nr:acetolactate synthase small subunit [Clostridiales bacterium]